jgi:DNA-binding response OmpR family regulator
LRQQVDCAIVLITSADTVEDRLRGFTAGADDHLGKPFSLAELLARADALMRRTGRWVQQVYKVGDLLLDDTSRTVLRGDGDMVLTRTEYDLLRVFCRHPGRVLTKRQLLVHVWGPDTVEDNVVEVHLSALRRKLESHGPRLLHTVRGVGFVLRA